MEEYLNNKFITTNKNLLFYHASWRSQIDATILPSTLRSDLISMLSQNVPVIMSFYNPSNSLPTYVISDNGESLVRLGGFSSHFFVVTAYFKYNGEYWCQISSAGEVKYFKVSDYLSLRCNDVESNVFNASSYMVIQRKLGL